MTRWLAVIAGLALGAATTWPHLAAVVLASAGVVAAYRLRPEGDHS